MDDAVPDDWTTRLAAVIADAVREFAPSLGGAPVVLFAVDCHPWHGSLDLALLTAAEIAADPMLADPDEMASWRYFSFSDRLDAWRPAAELGRRMRLGYEAAADHARVAEEFLRACAVAVSHSEVQAAFGSLVCAAGFRVTVTHPDSGREYVLGSAADHAS